jgi:hypothetical protein
MFVGYVIITWLFIRMLSMTASSWESLPFIYLDVSSLSISQWRLELVYFSHSFTKDAPAPYYLRLAHFCLIMIFSTCTISVTPNFRPRTLIICSYLTRAPSSQAFRSLWLIGTSFSLGLPRAVLALVCRWNRESVVLWAVCIRVDPSQTLALARLS